MIDFNSLNINPIWLWVGAILAGLVIGAIISLVIFGVYSMFRNRYLKYKMPKEIDNLEFANPGKAHSLSIKEVEENERFKFDRFREFEKLRRFTSKGEPATQGATELYSRAFRDAERNHLQNKTIENNRSPSVSDEDSTRDDSGTVKLD